MSALIHAMVMLFLARPETAEAKLRGSLAVSSGTVQLPGGTIEVSTEIRLPDGAHDLTIVGSGTTLRAANFFAGRAIISCHACRNVTLRDFSIDGNRGALEVRQPLPPTDWAFIRFFRNNGLLFDDAQDLRIENIDFRNIAGFAVLVDHSSGVAIERVSVKDSGSRNWRGRNNTTGGILLEEGTTHFSIKNSNFSNIRGNGVWTHSCYGSARNGDGVFSQNSFHDIGRDAIQVGHASRVSVFQNTGVRIGMNVDEVDLENLGTPVGIDTAGNVDSSDYEENRFEEINGKCIDLDGFHDGTVRRNSCSNHGKPEDYIYGNFAIAFNNSSIDMRSQNVVVEENEISGMKFGAIFVIGAGHTIRRNSMRNLNTAHCNETHAKFGCIAILDEPEFLESGIYLGKAGERPAPATNLVIEDNLISGYKMAAHCIESAPGVKKSQSTIKNNRCQDE